MLENISLCVIKIEIEQKVAKELPRLQKERDRDRGRRVVREIKIETFSNQFWLEKSYKNSAGENMNWAAVVQTGNVAAGGSSREQTPLGEKGEKIVSTVLPKEINFFSGNPDVEVIRGIIHLYKKNEHEKTTEAPSNQLCLLAVPSTLDCHDLISFLGPCQTEIKHVRILRDGSPNEFMSLLEFRTNEAAGEFYKSFNGVAYNSLEPDTLCHAVWVSSVVRGNDGAPPSEHTELPTCPVCLERMDESVDGVLTILCNHVFHANCLMKWPDSTCPVCRHVQTPGVVEDSVCMECESTDSLWICLICGHVGCGRYQGAHAAAHYRATNHTYALQVGTSRVWDYAGDNFVHRIFQNKTDGKLVAMQTEKDECEDKMNSVQMEYTYMLTTQLEAQRKFYEDRMNCLLQDFHDLKSDNEVMKLEIAELKQKENAYDKDKLTLERKVTQQATKLKEVQKQLNDDRELSKAVRDNQSCWHTKYLKLDKEYETYKKDKESELLDIKEQLRDVMFSLEAQANFKDSEYQGASVSVPPMEQQQKSKGSRHKNIN